MKVTIYHNPRCRKSRETLALLKEKEGSEIEVREYLKEPISKEEYEMILQQLNTDAEALIRKNESLFKQEYKGLNFNNDEWIQVLLKHPKLMERPIVVKGSKAVIGRPPENIEGLF